MKRLFSIFIVLTLLLTLCGCKKTSINKGADITLTFVYKSDNINVVLEDSESEKIISILDGNRYISIFSAAPSCGFSENVSLKIGNQIFAIARDNCNNIHDITNSKYFDISKEDMDYIRSVFIKYGGYFPCV